MKFSMTGQEKSFFSHGLRSVKIEKELEKNRFIPLELFDT
jgi:hypothetical protein